tara:strand:+ start:1052 stop:1534 length:483 start_codon:yes stop_codon:yes gene_type:complete
MPGGFFGKKKDYKGNDNFYTLKKDWEIITKFIPNNKKIWSPFYGDGKQKEYFKEMGYDIIHEDEDFYENNKGDIIIDNPPFSKKKNILMRLKELEKPFILIMPLEVLSYQYFKIFKNDIQIIIPNKRINFLQPNGDIKKFNYDCAYFCYKMNLPKDLIFI